MCVCVCLRFLRQKDTVCKNSGIGSIYFFFTLDKIPMCFFFRHAFFEIWNVLSSHFRFPINTSYNFVLCCRATETLRWVNRHHRKVSAAVGDWCFIGLGKTRHCPGVCECGGGEWGGGFHVACFLLSLFRFSWIFNSLICATCFTLFVFSPCGTGNSIKPAARFCLAVLPLFKKKEIDNGFFR